MRSSATLESRGETPICQLRESTEGMPALSINLETLRQLQQLAIEGLNAIPRRGLEVGGIVAGQVAARGGNPPEVLVTAIIPVEVAHSWGPSFQLNDNDVERMRRTVGETAPALDGTNEHVLGWWRTDTRSGSLSRSLEDDNLMRHLFQEGPALFLLIRPSILDGFRCSLHAWEDDVWHSSSEFVMSLAESSNDALAETVAPVSTSTASLEASADGPDDELADGAQTAANEISTVGARTETRNPEHAQQEECARTAVPNTAQFAEPDRLPSLAPLPPRGDAGAGRNVLLQKPSRRLWAAVIAASVAFLATIALLLEGRTMWELARARLAASPVGGAQTERSDQGADASGRLAIRAQNSPDGIRITWDTGSAAIAGARSGTLSIEDGNRETNVDLSVEDLRHGAILYRAQTDSLRLRLQVLGEGTTALGTLQMIGDGSEKSLAPPRTAAQIAPEVVAEPAAGRKAVAPAAQFRPRATEGLRVDDRPRVEQARRSTRTFNEPPEAHSLSPGSTPLVSVPTGIADGERPPELRRMPQPTLGAAREGIAPSPPAASRASLSEPDCQPEIRTIAYMKPGSPFGFLRGLKKLPFVPGDGAASPQGRFVAPALLSHRCPPRQQLIATGTPSTVDFMVELDDRGRIDSAVPTGPGEHSAASEQVRRMLNEWRFRPAMLGEKSVESEVLLRVRFYAGRVPENSGQ